MLRCTLYSACEKPRFHDRNLLLIGRLLLRPWVRPMEKVL
jgi:hypothetical protein